MGKIKQLIEDHPNIWEFIKFNVLSNCATITNFIIMWLCTGFIFKSFANTPFKFLVFNYADNIESNLGLCGFLSFLVATAAAQTVNFFVQKNLVFKSNAAFEKAVPKYIVLAVVLVLVSAALPAYSQSFFKHALALKNPDCKAIRVKNNHLYLFGMIQNFMVG